jgi:L-ascorbate metabolism protein UlaG (beta-lactamase superfamily)
MKMTKSLEREVSLMKVTYLGHSGFLVETDSAYYLFDYIRGTLPEWNNGKPLYVFASHSHEDHFIMSIFDNDISSHVSAYLLGSDIKKRLKREKLPDSVTEKILWANPGETISLPYADSRVTSLKSTDTGAAFIVEEGENVLYHAGDLNWWHWEGENKAWNRNMEVNYKREIDKLRGRKITAAFVPLDPRQGESYRYGMDYLLGLENTKIEHVFPMHFWKEYNVINRYREVCSRPDKIMNIEYEGQVFVLHH